VLINALGMERELPLSFVFCLFCIDFCALKYHDLDLAILSFYWSNWPHLLVETWLYELFVLINALRVEGEQFICVDFCLFL
jgi:hypothetical protein